MTEGKFTLPRGFVTDVRAAVAGKVRMDDVAPKFYREYLAARAHKMTMLQYFRVFDSTLPESITRMTLPKIQKQFPNYNHLRYLLRRGQNLAMVPNLVNKRKGAEK